MYAFTHDYIIQGQLIWCNCNYRLSLHIHAHEFRDLMHDTELWFRLWVLRILHLHATNYSNAGHIFLYTCMEVDWILFMYKLCKPLKQCPRQQYTMHTCNTLIDCKQLVWIKLSCSMQKRKLMSSYQVCNPYRFNCTHGTKGSIYI